MDKETLWKTYVGYHENMYIVVWFADDEHLRRCPFGLQHIALIYAPLLEKVDRVLSKVCWCGAESNPVAAGCGQMNTASCRELTGTVTSVEARQWVEQVCACVRARGCSDLWPLAPHFKAKRVWSKTHTYIIIDCWVNFVFIRTKASMEIKNRNVETIRF